MNPPYLAVFPIQLVASSLIFVAVSEALIISLKAAKENPLSPMCMYLVKFKLHPTVAISKLQNIRHPDCQRFCLPPNMYLGTNSQPSCAEQTRWTPLIY